MPHATEMQPLSNEEVVELAEREGDPSAAYYRLLFQKTLTDEQKVRLLKIVRKSPEVVTLARETLSWLTDDHTNLLRNKAT